MDTDKTLSLYFLICVNLRLNENRAKAPEHRVQF